MAKSPLFTSSKGTEMMCRFGRSSSVIVTCMLILTAVEPFRFAFSQQSSCIQAAFDRFSAKQQELTSAFNTAAAPLNWKFSRDIKNCDDILIAEVAVITIIEGGGLSACNADPEPITRTWCIESALFEIGVLVGAATLHRSICGDAAWVDYIASYAPLYDKYQEDLAATWARLQDDYNDCINAANGGYGS